MIFAVYLLSFGAASILNAVWHLLLFQNQYGLWLLPVARMVDGKIAFQPIPALLSQALFVAATMFFVLLGTKGHQKSERAALIGAACGILAISVCGLANYAVIGNWGIEMTILEVVWGPMLGAGTGMTIAYLGKKLLH